MKRSLKTEIDKAANKKERNQKILKLRAKRDEIDSQIDNLTIENEIDSIDSTIETTESLLMTFVDNLPPDGLTADTPLNVILSPEEKAEMFEKIFEHYGVKIPDNEPIDTLADLVAVVDRLR